jgi:hypothetical protein
MNIHGTLFVFKKIRFANQVHLFQDAFIFQNSIEFCYNQQIVALQSLVPSPKSWVVCEYTITFSSPIVTSCVLNQTHKH